MWAVYQNHADCVKFLIARKADLTIKATELWAKGKTALDIALVKSVKPEVAQLVHAAVSPPPPAPPAPVPFAAHDLVTSASESAQVASDVSERADRKAGAETIASASAATSSSAAAGIQPPERCSHR